MSAKVWYGCARRTRVDRRGIPTAHIEVLKPRLGVSRLTGRGKHAIPERCAGFGEVVVPITFVPHTDDAPEIAAELLQPLSAEIVGVGLYCFCESNGLHEDTDTPYDYGVGLDTKLLTGPRVADELGSKVPLFGPAAIVPLSARFVVTYDGEFDVLAHHVEAAGIDKGVAGDGVHREARQIERDSKGELEGGLTVHKVRLNMIGQWGVLAKVFLDGGPYAVGTLRGGFELGDLKVAPIDFERRVGADKGVTQASLVDEDFLPYNLESVSEGAARMKVDGEARWS